MIAAHHRKLAVVSSVEQCRLLTRAVRELYRPPDIFGRLTELSPIGVELDVPEGIQARLTRSGMPGRFAGIVATEFSILYYALAAWRRDPFVPARSRAFSYHRKNALLAILYTVLATAVIELAALVRDRDACRRPRGGARQTHAGLRSRHDGPAERAANRGRAHRCHGRLRNDADGNTRRVHGGRPEHFLTCSRAASSVRLRHSV